MTKNRIKFLVVAGSLIMPFSAVVNATDGEAIYNGTCKMCHTPGLAGAPKLGDKAAWEARIAKGTEALDHSAISGIGIMPAKGGNKKLSDEEVKAAVAYMVDAAK